MLERIAEHNLLHLYIFLVLHLFLLSFTCLASFMTRVDKKPVQNVQLRCFHKLFQGPQVKPLLVCYVVFIKLFLCNFYFINMRFCNVTFPQLQIVEKLLRLYCMQPLQTQVNLSCFLRKHYFSEKSVLLPSLRNFI